MNRPDDLTPDLGSLPDPAPEQPAQAEVRTCKCCGEAKELEKFVPTRQRNKAGERYRLYTCWSCRNADRRSQYHTSPRFRARHLVAVMNAAHRCKGQRVDMDAGAELLLNATRCQYCGQPNDGQIPFALDHKQPVALGGRNALENLVPCCEPCNRAKHDMPLDDYLTWLAGVIARSLDLLNHAGGVQGHVIQQAAQLTPVDLPWIGHEGEQ